MSVEKRRPLATDWDNAPDEVLDNERLPFEGDSVLIVQKQWLQLILRHVKSIEVRSWATAKREIFFMKSLTGLGKQEKKQPRQIIGFARISHIELLDEEKWEFLRSEHRVSGTIPYSKTYAWHLQDVVSIIPVPFVPKHGAVRLATYRTD
jgi:hypothetical protein